MSQPLPSLRMNLEFMPSPVEDRPGLLIRDSYGYSDAVLIIPPPLVSCLGFFDGQQSDLDLKAMLVRLTGELDVAPIVDQLRDTLSEAGFLNDKTYLNLKEEAEQGFRQSALREASHAGTAYPDSLDELKATLASYLNPADPEVPSAMLSTAESPIAIAAPHVSPFGGWQTYGAAYSTLGEEHRDKTFVILGTSHYGQANRFGLTRKPFITPLGTARPDLTLINELANEPAALMEDYCHAIEHSIEFQILFLQHLYGPEIRIVPLLCGSFAHSILKGGLPEDDDSVNRFFNRLGNIGAREGKKVLWILGIDMAHMGARYGDEDPAEANRGYMATVESRDRERIDRMNEGDSRGFWQLVQQNQDDLKWCGSSPVYTFLKAVPEARGTLRAYQQWNIDEKSVVSFAALTFRAN
ncbi:MAG: AmmeMemoRadiSam system protein B [Bryobacteraceae bacterium]|nr:AmmeMemoRadiSam system protein B [Bryobacteraceae bacterium]